MVKIVTNKSINLITHSWNFLFFLFRMWRNNTQQFRSNPKPRISLQNREFRLHLGYFPWGWKQNCSSHLSTLQSSTFLRMRVCCSLTLACKNVVIVGHTLLRVSLSTNVICVCRTIAIWDVTKKKKMRGHTYRTVKEPAKLMAHRSNTGPQYSGRRNFRVAAAFILMYYSRKRHRPTRNATWYDQK